MINKGLLKLSVSSRAKKVWCKEKPSDNKIYTCDKDSSIVAVPEFADMGGVLIAYPGTVAPPANEKQLPPSGPRMFGIPNELIIRMQQLEQHGEEPVHIFIMCNDSSQKEKIVADLEVTAEDKDLKFDSNLIHLVPWDTDTYWTRDYGPWWIKNKENGYYGIAKHVYTSLGGGSVGLVEGTPLVDPRSGAGIFRPNDDYGADEFSDFLNTPIRLWNCAHEKDEQIKPHNWFFTGLLDVGGNYMVNGEDVIASSYLVAKQNELPDEKEDQLQNPDAETIKKRMEYITEQCNRFLGIKKYQVLTDPSGTYIGHIDCWGKFLAKDKVLIAQSEVKEINEAYDEISKFFEDDGFEVFRVLCQDVYIPGQGSESLTTAAYTNSLILNKCVYIPASSNQYEKCNEKARDVYQKALPDYDVHLIPSKPETPWLGTDAMHCRTRAVPREVVNNWLKANLLDAYGKPIETPNPKCPESGKKKPFKSSCEG